MTQISFQDNKPKLYIVSTPIGNLKDMTIRALDVLKEVDHIYAEDTRTSKKLMSFYNISKPLFSYHEHLKFEGILRILEDLKQGKNVALISDAGTPLISDPGSELVTKTIEHGFSVIPIPGASAMLAGLVVSNMDLSRFTFIGFLPRKESEIKKELTQIIDLKQTLIFYESPNRVIKTLALMFEIFGDRNVSIMKELTKNFETIWWTKLSEIDQLDMNLKGEFVIVLEGNKDVKTFDIKDAIVLVETYIEDGLSEKEAMRQAAKQTNISKNEIYQYLKVKKS